MGADRATVVVGTVAIAPAVWWIASLVPSDVDPATADYLVEPPSISSAAAAVVGITSLVLVLVAAVTLVRASQSSRLGWAAVSAPMAALSAYVGLTYAATTAPVIGANIGAGLLLLAALPFTVAMVVIAAVAMRRSVRLER